MVLVGRVTCMQSVRSSVCVSARVLGTWVSCTNMTEPIEMPFDRLTHMGPGNHVLDESRSDQSICSCKGWQDSDATFCHIAWDSWYCCC